MNRLKKKALTLYSSGESRESIENTCQVTDKRLRKFIKSKKGKEFLAQRQEDLDSDFSSLYGKVVSALREALSSEDTNARISAASLWLKVNKEQKLSVTLTAEDLIQKLREDGSAV